MSAGWSEGQLPPLPPPLSATPAPAGTARHAAVSAAATFQAPGLRAHELVTTLSITTQAGPQRAHVFSAHYGVRAEGNCNRSARRCCQQSEGAGSPLLTLTIADWLLLGRGRTFFDP